jgi:hypothetical protein
VFFLWFCSGILIGAFFATITLALFMAKGYKNTAKKMAQDTMNQYLKEKEEKEKKHEH